MFRIKTIGLAEVLDGVLKSRGRARRTRRVRGEKTRSPRTRRCSSFFAIVHDLAAAAR
jgi:hypothetical protein